LINVSNSKAAASSKGRSLCPHPQQTPASPFRRAQPCLPATTSPSAVSLMDLGRLASNATSQHGKAPSSHCSCWGWNLAGAQDKHRGLSSAASHPEHLQHRVKALQLHLHP